MAKRSSQMITSETHLPSLPSSEPAPCSRWSQDGCCGSRFQRHVETSRGGKERPSLPPAASQESRSSPQKWLSGLLTSRSRGWVTCSLPNQSWQRVLFGSIRLVPGAGGRGGCLVHCHVHLQTSTWLPMTPSSPTPCCNSLSLSMGKTRD